MRGVACALIASAALLFGASTQASAGCYGNCDRDRDGYGYRDDDGDRGDWHDNGHGHGHYDNGWHGRGHHHWERGHRYTGRVVIVQDYERVRLRPPPRGYHWVRSDNGDFLLVAVTTGVIASIIAAAASGN